MKPKIRKDKTSLIILQDLPSSEGIGIIVDVSNMTLTKSGKVPKDCKVGLIYQKKIYSMENEIA